MNSSRTPMSELRHSRESALNTDVDQFRAFSETPLALRGRGQGERVFSSAPNLIPEQSRVPLRLLVIVCLLLSPASSLAEPNRLPVDREILIPFEDLQPILDQQRGHILLSRDEYETLLAANRNTENSSHPPYVAMATSANYSISVVTDRAEIVGHITIDVFEPGLNAVEFDVGNVGILRATLDGNGAPLAQTKDGLLTLFIDGVGPHTLELDLTAPVQTTVTEQSLSFQVPVPPATRLSLSVKGNVELRGGAGVLSRRFDEATQLTSFDLLPMPRRGQYSENASDNTLRYVPAPDEGMITLVLSRNSHFFQAQRAVLSRAVLVDEVCAAYERLHATFSMTVLHQPVDQFRFAIPDGFEITDVQSPLLASWATQSDGKRNVLNVNLREASAGRIVLGVSALRLSSNFKNWSVPRLEPLDVVGQAAVVGLLLEDQLTLQSISSAKLISIDTAVITNALPPSVASTASGGPKLRTVAAFYAPSGTDDFDAAASLDQPPERLFANTNVLFSLEDNEIHARAGFSLQPQAGTLYFANLLVPVGWHVSSLTDGVGGALTFEALPEYGSSHETRVHVALPKGVGPGSRQDILIEATYAPPGWLSHWMTTSIPLPIFHAADSERELGAVAVRGTDEMTIYADETHGLIPLDDRDRAEFGLTELDSSRQAAAFRYDRQPYHATLRIERTPPRLMAKTYSFFRLAPELLEVHAELVFAAERASVNELRFSLPADSPADLTITGLEGVLVKESESEIKYGRRFWTVHLAERRRGTLRVAVDFEQAWSAIPLTNVNLPIARAVNVAHQSGVIAVEGAADVNVEVVTCPRRVDLGELAGALYRPTQGAAGGLGAYAFIGDDPTMVVRLKPYTIYDLPTAVVQRSELVTQLSESGVAQTAVRLSFRSRMPFLEIELPPTADLWAVQIDGKPIQPQRDADRLLMSIPTVDRLIDLHLVYSSPVSSVRYWGDVQIVPPRFFVRSDKNAERGEVPTADLAWHVRVPPGFQLVDSDGTVASGVVTTSPPAAWQVAEYLWTLTGGINPLYGDCLPKLSRARELSSKSLARMATNSSPDNSRAFDAADFAFDKDESFELNIPAQPEMLRSPANAKKVPQGGQFAIERKSVMEKTHADQRAGKTTATSSAYWALEGVRSLQIDLEEPGHAFTFYSLGTDPRLRLSLANGQRMELLGWGFALATILGGLACSRRSLRIKSLYVLLVFTVSTIVPLFGGGTGLYQVANPVFYAACLVVTIFATLPIARWLKTRAEKAIFLRRPTLAALALAILIVTPSAFADQPTVKGTADDPVVVNLVDSTPPIATLEDAVIVPFDASDPKAWPPQPSNQVLISYSAFQRLWAQAYPDPRKMTNAPPTPFAWLGGEYTTSLGEESYLELSGHLDLAIYVDDFVSPPLSLADGVLSSIQVDDRPASVTSLNESSANDSSPNYRSLSVQVQGRGTHRITLNIRFPVTRNAGWRMVKGQVPSVPGTAIIMNIPQADTEVQLDGMNDALYRDTITAAESLTTALASTGTIQLKWRQRIRESVVDSSLTAASNVLLDIREDGIHVIWKIALDSGRGRKNEFRLALPAEYTIQSIDGPNVRGWSTAPETKDEIIVSLLAPSEGKEDIAVILHQQRRMMDAAPVLVDCPAVRVVNASLQNGMIAIRRSSCLKLVTDSSAGVTRIDTPTDLNQLVTLDKEGAQSPLGMSVYQAYRFASLPLSIKLRSIALTTDFSAKLDTVLRIGDWKRTIESRVNINPKTLPVHQVRLSIPDDLTVDSVRAPGAFEWSVIENTPRTVQIQLAEGRKDSFSVVLRGVLGQDGAVDDLHVPRILVQGAKSQTGEIAVQVDAAFDLSVEPIKECKEVPPSEAYEWLVAAQRTLTRTVLSTSGNSYDAKLKLTPRTPDVSVTTITNARVTESTVEETILMDFDITQAGIRSLSFLLPHELKDARITAPMLRTRTMEPATQDAAGPMRIKLAFQDEIMGRIRVLVEHDRPLTADAINVHRPSVETGSTKRVFASFESAGRDEVVVDQSTGFDPVVPGQREWAQLTNLVGFQLTQAYIATGSDPILTLKLHERVAVETTGARIGLARTLLVADASGAYRATQRYVVDNRSEQFLDVDLPKDATLWSVEVAGKSVKPAKPANTTTDRLVRIPLTKTAAGDLDFEVVFKYGGVLPTLGALRQVDFPMLCAVNIPIELSQATLYLPEEFRWLDFGGTMRLVDDRDELAAGYVQYQTRQTERLGLALANQSPFAQARAANNLQEVKSKIDRLRKNVRGENQSLTQQFLSNEDTLERVQQQQAQIDLQTAAVHDLDNRGKLSNCFDVQQVDLSRNTLQVAADNFDESAIVAQKGEKDRVSFDEKWLSGNNDPNMQIQTESVGKNFQRVQTPEQIQSKQNYLKAPALNAQVFRDSLAQQSAAMGGNEPAQPPPIRRGQAGELNDVAKEYKRQLGKNQEEGEAGGKLRVLSSPKPVALAGREPLPGLSIDFPVRGTAYYFTTPRGDETITARAISHRFTERFIRLVVAIVAVAIVAFAAWFLSRQNFTGLVGRRLANVMIVLGMISLLGGVLPVVGLLTVITGCTMRSRIHRLQTFLR